MSVWTRRAASLSGPLFAVTVMTLFALWAWSKYRADFALWLAPECTPNAAALTDLSLYHHLVGPCGRHIEEDFRRGEDGDELEYRIGAVTNSLGFRNDEYLLDKPPNATRIILIGDSFTYGLGVHLEETFFKLLEEKLNQRQAGPIEVWNIATLSWATVVEERFIREQLAAYSPDFVWILFDLTDFTDNLAFTEVMLPDQTFGENPNGHIYWKKRNAYFRTLIKDPPEKTVLLRRRAIASAEACLVSAAHHLEGLAVPFEVVFYPYAWTTDRHESTILQPLLQRLQAREIPFANLFDRFDPEQRDALYFEGNYHWNAEGNRYAAELLTERWADLHERTLAAGSPSRPQSKSTASPRPFDLLRITRPFGGRVEGLGAFESDGETSWRWGFGPRATVQLNLQKTTGWSIHYRADCLSPAQSVEIFANGVQLVLHQGRHVQGEVSFQVGEGLSELQFVFADWNHRTNAMVADDERRLACKFFDLRVLPE